MRQDEGHVQITVTFEHEEPGYGPAGFADIGDMPVQPRPPVRWHLIRGGPVEQLLFGGVPGGPEPNGVIDQPLRAARITGSKPPYHVTLFLA